MNNVLKTVIVVIVILAAAGAIGNHYSNSTPSNSGLSQQAMVNTEKNAAVNSCEADYNASPNSTNAEAKTYCTCTVNSLYAEYGQKLFSSKFLNALQANGFTQHDTQILQNCLKDAGITQ